MAWAVKSIKCEDKNSRDGAQHRNTSSHWWGRVWLRQQWACPGEHKFLSESRGLRLWPNSQSKTASCILGVRTVRIIPCANPIILGGIQPPNLVILTQFSRMTGGFTFSFSSQLCKKSVRYISCVFQNSEQTHAPDLENHVTDSVNLEEDDFVHKEELEITEFVSKYVGDNGQYQWIASIAMILTDWTNSMLILSPVFIAAIPEHTCNVTKYTAAVNCSLEARTNAFLPKEKRHGHVVPSQCQYFNFYFDSTWNKTQDAECENLNFTGLPLHDCDEWTYDTTYYTSTIVTDVSKIFFPNFCNWRWRSDH